MAKQTALKKKWDLRRIDRGYSFVTMSVRVWCWLFSLRLELLPETGFMTVEFFWGSPPFRQLRNSETQMPCLQNIFWCHSGLFWTPWLSLRMEICKLNSEGKGKIINRWCMILGWVQFHWPGEKERVTCAVKEKQSWTAVKAVKADFIQGLLQQGEKLLSVKLGSVPNTRRTNGGSFKE